MELTKVKVLQSLEDTASRLKHSYGQDFSSVAETVRQSLPSLELFALGPLRQHLQSFFANHNLDMAFLQQLLVDLNNRERKTTSEHVPRPLDLTELSRQCLLRENATRQTLPIPIGARGFLLLPDP